MGERYPAIQYTGNMREHFSDGVWTIDCDSWTEFEDRIEEFNSYNYVWRGQGWDQPLWPNIYRDSTPDDQTIKEHLCQFRKDMPGGNALKQFLEQAKKARTQEYREALSGYYEMVHPKRDANDPEENYEMDLVDDIYWAIGQHHGLKTPLLDWTMDPYTALFFALCERKKEDSKRVVVGLAEKNRLLLKNGPLKKRYIELLTNLTFVQTILDSSGSPPTIKEIIRPMFARIKGQKGIFTRSLHRECVESHARRCYSYYEEHRKQRIVFLIKILIPNGVRKDVLQKLEGMDITYKTMFPPDVCRPDLFGTVSNCNLKLEPNS